MVDTLAETDPFAAFLADNEGKDLLRFLTCGSVAASLSMAPVSG